MVVVVDSAAVEEMVGWAEAMVEAEGMAGAEADWAMAEETAGSVGEEATQGSATGSAAIQTRAAAAAAKADREEAVDKLH